MKLKIFDTVANISPITCDRLILVDPNCQSIQRLPVGQVGAIVEIYPGESPRYLVEFADLQGREYAMAVLQPTEIIALKYELSSVG
ncbi:MAG: DUF4926 domain-containing protein [Cyanobacteria bacterium RI_101]|nr:DUF4926 domain-containing protein [Cyanobacteria bacterium RI_101]